MAADFGSIIHLLYICGEWDSADLKVVRVQGIDHGSTYKWKSDFGRLITRRREKATYLRHYWRQQSDVTKKRDLMLWLLMFERLDCSTFSVTMVSKLISDLLVFRQAQRRNLQCEQKRHNKFNTRPDKHGWNSDHQQITVESGTFVKVVDYSNSNYLSLRQRIILTTFLWFIKKDGPL